MFGVFFFPALNVCAETPDKVCVITDNTKVYKEANTTSEVLLLASFNQEFVVIDDSDENFYYIQLTSNQGYILKAFCVNVNNAPLAKNLDTNAKIKSTTHVFNKVENEFVEVPEITLESGTRVKLLSGTNNNDKYWQITFSQDNQQLTFYVESSNVDADGISIKIVTAILLIITCVILFLIIYGFYRSRKKASLQKK